MHNCTGGGAAAGDGDDGRQCACIPTPMLPIPMLPMLMVVAPMVMLVLVVGKWLVLVVERGLYKGSPAGGAGACRVRSR